MDIRIGTGFDVHRFGPGDHCMLCGVAVPHDRGLDGHSDADVGMHALRTRYMGPGRGRYRAALPPSDPQWKGADSHVFLRHAVELARTKGFTINNMDITWSANAPRSAPMPRPCNRPCQRSRASTPPDLGQGDDIRTPRLYRARRRNRGPGRRDIGEDMRVSHLIATVFHIGHLRPAPGTWASLLALPLAWGLHLVGGPWPFRWRSFSLSHQVGGPRHWKQKEKRIMIRPRS